MAFVRILGVLLKDKQIGRNIVPIVPDEARTFGMEGLFRQIGIYSSMGQLYTPQDADQLMSYREDKQGQMLEEGINEAGAMCSWIAAATSYANLGVPMIPFYIYYSMFGFQRVGDFIWAAGDMRARGFLLGATAGRTTLAGEGLQHQDGHSHLLASTVPNCRAYDPAYAYELTVIIHDGMKRMYVDGEGVFYYISVMNENYAQPALPEGSETGIIKGGYRLRTGGRGKVRSTLLGSGTILREVLAAAELLEQQFGIPADVYSITSFTELRREALDCERWNLLHPEAERRVPYVRTLFGQPDSPVVAATDYMRSVADQIRQWVAAPYVTLGTDGFGRSDARAPLRRHFEVDRNFIALAALKSLADANQIDQGTVALALNKLGIDASKPNPLNS
jgi:pyruvate dehydrogenase E1 component